MEPGSSTVGTQHVLRFYTIAEAARLLRLSPMTLYRAVEAGQFPAIKIRTRIVVPAQAIDNMVNQALAGNRPVDAAAWARGDVA